MSVTKGRWWLTQDSEQLVINAPAEPIYDLIADLPRMGEWSPECKGVEWADGAPVATEGATFVGHNRGGPFRRTARPAPPWWRLIHWSRRGRVLATDPGRKFAFVTEEGGRESTVWRYRFEPVDGGTRVTESYEVKWIPAWARIIDDVPTNRHRELREGMRHTLEQLEAAAEASPSGGQP